MTDSLPLFEFDEDRTAIIEPHHVLVRRRRFPAARGDLLLSRCARRTAGPGSDRGHRVSHQRSRSQPDAAGGNRWKAGRGDSARHRRADGRLRAGGADRAGRPHGRGLWRGGSARSRHRCRAARDPNQCRARRRHVVPLCAAIARDRPGPGHGGDDCGDAGSAWSRLPIGKDLDHRRDLSGNPRQGGATGRPKGA